MLVIIKSLWGSGFESVCSNVKFPLPVMCNEWTSETNSMHENVEEKLILLLLLLLLLLEPDGKSLRSKSAKKGPPLLVQPK